MAALVPNMAGVSAGQRVRIETWAEYLRRSGWTVDFYPFEDSALHEVLYQRGRKASKAFHLLRRYVHQFNCVRKLGAYDVVFVHQEAALIGPALLERLATRGGTPLIVDLDDPRFIPYRSPTSGHAARLKFPGKTDTLLRMADHVIAINDLIGDYASRFNASVTVVPNSIDMDRYHLAAPAPGPPRLVWIGAPSSAANLATISTALQRLQHDCAMTVRLIGAHASDLPGVEVETRLWSAETEVRHLQECHVGLVPVSDTPWNHWKLFHKAIQYMAVGLPVVARPVGSNTELIEHGVNGFLAETQDEWYELLRLLIDDAALRQRMGAAARATVVERFAREPNGQAVTSVFERVVANA